LTCRVGSQTAADPDHRVTNRVADAARRLGGSNLPLAANRTPLFATALLVDFVVHWMDQHLRFLLSPQCG